ncbi:MAG TPA: SDR family oxidoreductase [Kofleriaceae bacterium]|jgi:dTDP-4-dehydrorhamnose reductase|nr:SDR family oxidoreductase [Kofleriaceae bacterium]
MQPILITGATGTLGRAFARLCAERYLACRGTARHELDITDPAAIAAAFDRFEPWLVVNAAGYVRVDDAEHDPARCHRDNALGPEILARACARNRVGLVTFSSDLVFDGRKREPYREDDVPAPLGVYGRTKHEAEARVQGAHPGALVVRTSACFGPWDDANFVTIALRELAAGREVRVAGDTIVSPTYLPDLVHACLDLAIDGEHGLWHLANASTTSWAELARSAAMLAGHRLDRIVPVACDQLPWRARRPAFSALGSARGVLLPSLGDALRRYHHARREERGR